MLTLLEFLTALPEEVIHKIFGSFFFLFTLKIKVNTTTIRIGENRRRYCREKYSNCGKQIHEILVRLKKKKGNNLFFFNN